jgi:hypothetical protein
MGVEDIVAISVPFRIGRIDDFADRTAWIVAAFSFVPQQDDGTVIILTSARRLNFGNDDRKAVSPWGGDIGLVSGVMHTVVGEAAVSVLCISLYWSGVIQLYCATVLLAAPAGAERSSSKAD